MKGAGTERQLRLRRRRRAHQGQELVQPQRLRHRCVRHAEPERRAAERHAVGGARPQGAERQPVRQRPAGLRADARPDAAHRVQPQSRHRTTTSASAASTKPTARTRPRTRCTTSASRRSVRSGGARSGDRVCRCSGPTAARCRRRRRRRSPCSMRSRAAARSRRAAITRGRCSSGPIWTTSSGKNSLRAGILFDGGWYRSDSTSNYLGTFTFDNLQAFIANQPSNYTRRIGDPNISYQNLQGAVYLQDDIRVRKNLTLSPGVRYEAQTHVQDYNNVGPRFGVDVGAVRERPDDAARQRGALLRLAAHGHLRPDAARRRIPAAGAQHPQSVVSRSGQHRRRDAGQPLSCSAATTARRGRRASAPGSIRTSASTSGVVATYSYQRVSDQSRGLNLNTPVERRAAGSALRQHRRRGVRRGGAPASAADRRERQSGRAAAGVQRTADQLEARDGVRQLPARVAAQQHRRPVRHSGHRRSERRVGTVAERRPQPSERQPEQPGGSESVDVGST